MANWIKQLAGQTAIYGASNVISKFLNYMLFPLYLRVLDSPSEYGVVTEYYAYIVVLMVMLTYGMETGFFRFSKKVGDRNRVLSTVLTSIIITSVIFVALIVIFSQSISNAIGYTDHPEYVIMFAFILGLDAVSAIFYAKLRAENKPLKFALIKIINILSTIIFVVFFLVFAPRIFTTDNFIYRSGNGVGYIFFVNLIASLIVFLLLIRELKGVKFVFDKKLYKQILIYSLPLLLTGLTGAFNEAADKYFIKWLTVVPQDVSNVNEYVTYQLGIYGANAKLAFIMMMFVQAFRYAAEPFFFSFKKTNDGNLKIFADVMKYFVILAFVMFLVVMLNLNIFKYFMTEEYFEGLKIVFPLFISRFLVGVFFVLSFWYKLNDVTAKAIYIFFTGAILTVVLNYFMIPKFGYVGAAWTNLSVYLIMVILSFIWSRKYMKVQYEYFKILVYIVLPIIFYFFTKNINISNKVLEFAFNNLFLLLFIIFVFKIEKIKLSDLKMVYKKILKK